MSPSMPNRYQRPQGQIPAGGPPSFTGGTPSGSQPMGAGDQQQQGPMDHGEPIPPRMPAPWDGPPTGPVDSNPLQGGQPLPGGGEDPAPVTINNRMQPPWMPQGGGRAQQPMGGSPRPQYQGGPGSAQRAVMSEPQAPSSPLTTQRQQQQNMQNRTT